MLALALATLVVLPAAADGADDDSAGRERADGPTVTDEGTARDAVRREALDERAYAAGTWRLRLSWPLQLAGAVGILFGRRPAAWDCESVCEFRGVHAQAELGTGGGQLAAGWASVVGEPDRSRRWLSSVYVGYAVRGVLLRTGGQATLSPPAQTFAGVEGTVAATRVNLSIALYRRLSGDSARDPWMIGAGLGWGF